MVLSKEVNSRNAMVEVGALMRRDVSGLGFVGCWHEETNIWRMYKTVVYSCMIIDLIFAGNRPVSTCFHHVSMDLFQVFEQMLKTETSKISSSARVSQRRRVTTR